MMDGTDAPYVCAASAGAHRPGRIDPDRVKREREESKNPCLPRTQRPWKGG
jgi:hypothetical protein